MELGQHPPPSSSSTSAAAPSIPTRTRYNSTTNPTTNHGVSSRRRSSQYGTSGGAIGSSKRQSIPPAGGAEVISNLISSLSGISKPADDYFEGKHATSNGSTPGPGSNPVSPSSASKVASPGSFGVDYGAYSKSSLGKVREDPVSLDELAASAPIIRTSKPTSGYSPLSPPKSPKTSPRNESRGSSSGGLRSFIRSSSAPGRPRSHDSRNDDAHSIGNLSVERRSAASPDSDLHHRRSHDSWGKKTSRSYKGLMYMSSKERLREKEERKRGHSSGAAGGAPGTLRSSNSYGSLKAAFTAGGKASSHSAGRPDPFLAETAISEESAHESSFPTGNRNMDNSPRPIPHRDSSLRSSSTPVAKRGSGRRSQRETNGASAPGNTTESKTPDRKARGNKKVPAKLDLEASSGTSFLLGPGENAPTQIHTPNTQRFLETIRDDYLAFDTHARATRDEEKENEGAPFPAVAQNRRRSAQSLDRASRRRSATQSPAFDDRPKRSSSRLKRLSRQSSPVAENRKPSDDVHIEADGLALERLDSADSIDDAVDSYLCSPRLSQKIKHPQTGRVICFSEVGDPEGSAVFCCVGMGLTRYITAFYDELALTLKLRLITPDRPGVGDSESYSDGTSTPLNWPDDVYAICQALKITKFSILAHSAGAIYALATALRMPQHIRGRIHLLAPWIPPSQMNVFGGSQNLPPTNAIPTSQRILRALPTPMLKVANSSFMSATSTSITTSLPKNPRRSKRRSAAPPPPKESAPPAKNGTNNNPSFDKENIGHGDYKEINGNRNGGETGPRSQSMTNGGHLRVNGHEEENREGQVQAAMVDAMADQERQITYDTRLTHAIWDLATTGANPAVDLLVCLERRHTIGFRYVDINRPVIIHHGSRDTRVPVDNVRWLGKTMRRCEVRVLEGEGHGLMASASVMGNVLMEISKEWEDWMRVTGADGRKEKERGRRGTIHR